MEIVNIIILEATDMLCNYNTEKLLGLKGVIVKNVRQLPDRTEIFIELPKEPHVCPCCGHKTSHVHDYRQQTVKDIPSFGKHTVLILRKRRYHCSFCGKHFFEEVLFLPRYSRTTSRLAVLLPFLGPPQLLTKSRNGNARCNCCGQPHPARYRHCLRGLPRR